MYKTITVSDFRDEFHTMNRGDQFSYDALGALYDFLRELENDTGEETELDVIDLCCNWTEYDNVEEALQNYNRIKSLEELKEETTVLELPNGGILLENF
jgi:hypothetical protein